MKTSGWSTANVSFGSGGSLIQKVNIQLSIISCKLDIIKSFLIKEKQIFHNSNKAFPFWDYFWK